MPIEQRRQLIRLLKLRDEMPNTSAIEAAVREMEAEMHEEDVVWVKAKLYD